MEIIIALAFTLIWAALAYSIALKRGVSIRFWVIMALIFGPLAIPFIFFGKKKPAKNSTDKRHSMLA